jgi:hypothetical protein
MPSEPSQTDRLYELLKDGKPYRTDQIQVLIYGANHLGVARIGARIADIKAKYHVSIKGWKDSTRPSLYWYQLVIPHEMLDHAKLSDTDVEVLFQKTVGRLKMFDFQSIDFINAYKAWQKDKGDDKKRTFVYLYNNLHLS